VGKPSNEPCDIDGCDRNKKTNGLCSGHAERLRLKGVRGGPLLTRTHRGGTCGISGCKRKVYSRRLCNTHYKRDVAGNPGGDIALRWEVPDSCTVDGCDAHVWARTWCSKHYQNWQNHGHPTEKLRDPGQGTCLFPGCDRKRRYGELCAGHYQARWKGRELEPLEQRWKNTDRDGQGRKCCRYCYGWKPESEFYARASSADNLGFYCKTCTRDVSLRRKFGVTLNEFNAMLARQGGVCLICGRSPEESPKGLFVDHDHTCCSGHITCGKCIRGILCHYCNAAIGLLGDDMESARRVVAYLETTWSGRLPFFLPSA